MYIRNENVRVDWKSTIVTTPLLPPELWKVAGLRQGGRSLWPEKWLVELVIAEEGATKSVEREFLKEDLMGLIGVRARDEDGEMSMGLFDKKVKDAFAVATSMVRSFVQSEEDSAKWKWRRKTRILIVYVFLGWANSIRPLAKWNNFENFFLNPY